MYPAWCASTWPKELQLAAIFCFVLFLSLWQWTKPWFCPQPYVDTLCCVFTDEGRIIYGLQTSKWAWSPDLAGCRRNPLLIQNVISVRELLYQQVRCKRCLLTQSLMITSLNWGCSDFVPAVFFTKNKLMLPKKRNESISATSDIEQRWFYEYFVSWSSSVYSALVRKI